MTPLVVGLCKRLFNILYVLPQLSDDVAPRNPASISDVCSPCNVLVHLTRPATDHDAAGPIPLKKLVNHQPTA